MMGRSSPDTPDELGRLGHYRLLRSLGRGAQGEVFLAEDLRLERRVALKVLSRGFADSHSEVIRFQREAAAASKLDHPSICSVYEAGEVDGTPYIAMRFIEGETLSKRIASARSKAVSEEGTMALPASGDGSEAPRAAEERPADTSSDTDTDTDSASYPTSRNEIMRATAIVEKTARALHVAHEAGLIHRDIKPGNIMVTPQDEPVVLDFGLARDEESQAQTLTHSGDLLGTPAYMSPEQLLAQRIKLDRRTDIYSLGVTLFECLTLRRPYDAPTRDALYQQILAGDPLDPRKLNPHISRDLKVIVETAIDKDRNRRYQTALGLAEDIRRWRDFEPILARPAGPVLRFARWVQRNPVVATATLGLFVTLATGLVISLVLYGRVRDADSHKQAALDLAQTETAEKTRALADLEKALADREDALEEARLERDKNSALYLTARGASVLAQNPGQALLLGLESARRHPNKLTSRLLLEALLELREEHTLVGHRGAVTIALWSSDGTRALTASGDFADRSARLWDAGTGETTAILRGHAGGITGAAFSRDGARVATGSDDGSTRTYETATGRLLAVLRTDDRWFSVNAIAFDPAGHRVVTASDDAAARIWDAASGELLATLSGHQCAVRDAAFSPDGSRVLTSSSAVIKTFAHHPDGRIRSWSTRGKQGNTMARIWDAASGDEILALGRHAGAVYARFSADGSRVFTAAALGYRIFDAASGEETFSSAAGESESNLFGLFAQATRTLGGDRVISFSADGRRVALSFDTGILEVRETASGAVLAEIPAGGSGHAVVSLSADGALTAIVPEARDDVIEVGEVATGRLLVTLQGHEDAVHAAVFSPDGSRLLSASSDGTARLWRIAGDPVVSRGIERTIAENDKHPPLLSPDGRRALLDGATLLDTASGEVVRQIEAPLAGIRLFEDVPLDHALFSASGERIVGFSRSGQVLVWDAATGAPIPLPVAAGRYVDAVVSPDGAVLADPYPDGRIRLHPLERGKGSSELPGDGTRIALMAFRDDGRRLATVSETTVRLWDVDERREIASTETSIADVELVVLSPGGERLLLVGQDGSLLLWEAGGSARGAHVGASLTDAAFSPDGERILVVSSDGRAGLVQFDGGGPAPFTASSVLAGDFDAGGSRLVTIHDDDSVTLWDASGETPESVAVLRGHRDSVFSAVFSPDGTRVVTASRDRTARLWDAANGRQLRVLGGHEDAVFCARFSADGERIVTASADRSVALWDARDGVRTAVLRSKDFAFNAAIEGMARRGWWQSREVRDRFSGDGSRLLTRSDGDVVRISDAGTGAVLFTEQATRVGEVRGTTSFIRGAFAALSSDGSLVLISGGVYFDAFDFFGRSRSQGPGAFAVINRPFLEVRRTEGGARVSRLRTRVTDVHAAAFSPDGGLVALADARVVAVFETAGGAEVATLPWRGLPTTLLFDPAGRTVLVGDVNNVFGLYDATSGEELFTRRGSGNSIAAAAFSPDARILATAEGDGAARLWNVSTGALLRTLSGHVGDLVDVVFSHDGRSLMTVTDDEVKAWDVASGAERISFPPLAGIRTARFTPDDREAVILHGAGIARWPIDAASVARGHGPRELTPVEVARHEIGAPTERELYRARYEIEKLTGDLAVLRRQGEETDAVAAEIRWTLTLLLETLGEEPAPGEAAAALELAREALAGVGRRDPGLLELVARCEVLNGRHAEAVITLEEAIALDPGNASIEGRLEACRRVALPDLVSFASIDAALEAREVIIPAGAEWRFFRGRESPAPGIAWTAVDFDDGAWERGVSGIGYDANAVIPTATVLDDMRANYTVVYLRHAFEVEDPAAVARLELTVRIDDGVVAWLNGEEVGRVGAGDPGVALGPASVATRTVEDATTELFAVATRGLRRGRNVLALLALNASPTSSDLTVIPVLAAELARDESRDRARFEAFRGACTDPDRLAYLEGRLLGRDGKHGEAAARFAAIVDRDGSRPEPWLRLAESLEAAGQSEAALERVHRALAAGLDAPALVDLWFRLALVELRRTPARALAALPAALREKEAGRVADVVWVVERLARGEAVRINCGGGELTDIAGRTWGGDRFHTGGSRYRESAGGAPFAGDIAGTDDDLLYQTERWFPPVPGRLPGYHIPLPPGEYRVTLHFAEIASQAASTRSFDVLVEGEAVPELTAYSPIGVGFATADALTLHVSSVDATFDIEFVHRQGDPKISAIEVEPRG